LATLMNCSLNSVELYRCTKRVANSFGMMLL
jgi:hypothetical protein